MDGALQRLQDLSAAQLLAVLHSKPLHLISVDSDCLVHLALDLSAERDAWGPSQHSQMDDALQRLQDLSAAQLFGCAAVKAASSN